MKLEIKKTNVFILVIVMLVGSILPYADVLFFFILCGFALIIAIVTFFLILFAIFDKTVRGKALYSIVIFISFVFSAIGMQSLVHYNRKNKAEEIVKEIENYKTINDKYPQSLEEINLENEIDGLKYNVEINGNYFLEYKMDGFKRQSFESKTKKWKILSWE